MKKLTVTAFLVLLQAAAFGQTLLDDIKGKTFFNNEHSIEVKFGDNILTGSQLSSNNILQSQSRSSSARFLSIVFDPLAGNYRYHGYITQNGLIGTNTSSTHSKLANQFALKDGRIFLVGIGISMQAEYDKRKKILSVRFENNVVVIFEED